MTQPIGLFGAYGRSLTGPLRRDEPEPDARPRRPHPDEPSPAVSERTRARLAALPGRAPPAPRHALAFVLAVGAVAALTGALRPWEVDT